MGDLKEWRGKVKPYTAAVDICADGALVAELEAAERRLEEERQNGMLEVPKELEAHVQKLAKKVAAETRTFTFQSIGRRAWRALMSDHPPTDQQREQEPDLDHNPETFPVAAILASCVEPRLSQEDAEWLADELPEGEFLRVWGALLRANVVGGDAKKAVATAEAVSSAKR